MWCLICKISLCLRLLPSCHCLDLFFSVENKYTHAIHLTDVHRSHQLFDLTADRDVYGLSSQLGKLLRQVLAQDSNCRHRFCAVSVKRWLTVEQNGLPIELCVSRMSLRLMWTPVQFCAREMKRSSPNIGAMVSLMYFFFSVYWWCFSLFS